MLKANIRQWHQLTSHTVNTSRDDLTTFNLHLASIYTEREIRWDFNQRLRDCKPQISKQLLLFQKRQITLLRSLQTIRTQGCIPLASWLFVRALLHFPFGFSMASLTPDCTGPSNHITE